MNAQQVLELLEKRGAVLRDGHFVYTSRRHGRTYVNKDAIYPFTQDLRRICYEMAQPFRSMKIHAVVGPAMGGILLAQRVTDELMSRRTFEAVDATKGPVLAIYADKSPDGGFVLKRGYDELVKGKDVLVVEDILTTGGSVRKVVELLRRHEANVVGVSAICNRGKVTAEAVGGVPKLSSLINLAFDAWTEDTCPACRDGVPVNPTIGKGAEFLERKKAQGL